MTSHPDTPNMFKAVEKNFGFGRKKISLALFSKGKEFCPEKEVYHFPKSIGLDILHTL